jgi:hypothetical protein
MDTDTLDDHVVACPFGYMCLHNIAAKYIDTGVTDAITKHDAYVASKTFTPSNITKWVSTVEHAWAGWRNTVTDPEHMAAVDLVREILSSDHEDWKTWASLTFWKRLLTRTSC